MQLSDIANELPRYRDWAPTQFDTQGLGLPDQQDWLVAPCTQTRDSGPMDASNFAACQAILTDAGVEHEVHRFGHWGPGWVEIIIVHPDGAECLAGIVSRLADYPLLDESDFCDREHECADESWEAWGADDFRRELAKVFGLADATIDRLPDNDACWAFHSEHAPEHYYADGDGVSFSFRYLATQVDPTRDDVAAFIRKHRSTRS